MAAMSAMAFEGVTVELTDHFRFRLIVSKNHLMKRYVTFSRCKMVPLTIVTESPSNHAAAATIHAMWRTQIAPFHDRACVSAQIWVRWHISFKSFLVDI